VGERWTLLVVRELLLGPRRYSELLARLEGITTNLLAKRLQELTAAGILEKRALPAPASADAYSLTPAGRELEPAIMELARWGGHFLAEPRKDDRRDLGWALLSMKRRYRGGDGARPFVVELVAGPRRFEVIVGEPHLGVLEKSAERADLRVTSSTESAFFEAFFGAVPVEKLERKGLLRTEGDRALWLRFLTSFAPPPAGSGRGSAAKQKAVLGRA
jgi:DNA-binding HxlR family transcriptional regulator